MTNRWVLTQNFHFVASLNGPDLSVKYTICTIITFNDFPHIDQSYGYEHDTIATTTGSTTLPLGISQSRQTNKIPLPRGQPLSTDRISFITTTPLSAVIPPK